MFAYTVFQIPTTTYVRSMYLSWKICDIMPDRLEHRHASSRPLLQAVDAQDGSWSGSAHAAEILLKKKSHNRQLLD